ncbi:MAG: hypothetical protein NVSMB19_03030 [Vulcanimicrobiaceae bacterium]
MNLFRTPEADADCREPRPRYGLALVRDIIVAPNAAFEKIAASREWLLAYGLVVVTGLLATALAAPALLHVFAVTPPPRGEAVPTTPAAVAEAKRNLVASYVIGQAIMPLAIVLLTASALTTVARFKGVTAQYALFLSLGANCMIPSAIGDLITALSIRLRDPASFHDLRALLVAVPANLAVFATAGNDREVAFLSHFDAFNVWAYVLLAFGVARLVPVSFTTALVVAFGIDVLFALLF